MGSGVVALPSGTVTFLFTDIEGSTMLGEQFAEAMGAALATHDGHLNTQENTWDGQVARQQTLDLVGLDDRAEEWIARGAAMTREEIAAYTLDQLPDSGRQVDVGRTTRPPGASS